MAIQKQKELPDGYSVNYHRIKKVEINKDGSGLIMVESFKDFEARQSGKTPVRTVFKYFSPGIFDITKGVTWEKAYEDLKSLEEYRDSIDV